MHLGELSTFGKELAGPLVAFCSEWNFFFFIQWTQDRKDLLIKGIFFVTYQLELFYSSDFGLSNTLP